MPELRYFAQPRLTQRPQRGTLDLPTCAVAAAVYGSWLAATALHRVTPSWALAGIGGWLIAWHGSLQHETIHGRPTGSARLNGALGAVPLSLWLPYRRYRESHLVHHATAHVTDPDHDPESRYLRREEGGLGLAKRAAAAAQATLLGRLVLGPPLGVAHFVWREARLLARGAPGVRGAWASHVVALAPVLLWLHAVRMGPVRYVLCFVLPGTALTLLRSFAEHHAEAPPGPRAAIVERAPLFGLLFLHNNLHAVHHARPDLVWWRLPGFYADNREAVLKANGGLVYRGYAQVAARYLLRPHDRLTHPRHRVAAAEVDV